MRKALLAMGIVLGVLAPVGTASAAVKQDPCTMWRPCKGNSRAPDVLITPHIVCAPWFACGNFWSPITLW